MKALNLILILGTLLSVSACKDHNGPVRFSYENPPIVHDASTCLSLNGNYVWSKDKNEKNFVWSRMTSEGMELLFNGEDLIVDGKPHEGRAWSYAAGCHKEGIWIERTLRSGQKNTSWIWVSGKVILEDRNNVEAGVVGERKGYLEANDPQQK